MSISFSKLVNELMHRIHQDIRFPGPEQGTGPRIKFNLQDTAYNFPEEPNVGDIGYITLKSTKSGETYTQGYVFTENGWVIKGTYSTVVFADPTWTSIDWPERIPYSEE